MLISRLSFWLFAGLSIVVALVSYRFLILGFEISFPGLQAHISDRKLSFLLHIFASPVALVLGVFQFMPRLRAKRLSLYRWTGRIYGLAVLIGGLSGLALAIGSTERPVAAAGFGILALFWVSTTAVAVRMAMEGRIVEHRRWMIRSMALTFAAVTLRLELPLYFIIGSMEYAEASNYVAWLCWVPNLLIAEWIIRHRGRPFIADRSGASAEN